MKSKKKEEESNELEELEEGLAEDLEEGEGGMKPLFIEPAHFQLTNQYAAKTILAKEKQDFSTVQS